MHGETIGDFHPENGHLTICLRSEHRDAPCSRDCQRVLLGLAERLSRLVNG